ncbi:hypothetical protein Tco_0731378 [Tanacetum coccineum]
MREEKLGTGNSDVDDEKRRLAELLEDAGRNGIRSRFHLKLLLTPNYIFQFGLIEEHHMITLVFEISFCIVVAPDHKSHKKIYIPALKYPTSLKIFTVLGLQQWTYSMHGYVVHCCGQHGQEAHKGGKLTHDRTIIISGALDLTEKVLGDMNIHGQEAHKGGELTHGRTIIISRALDLTENVLGDMNLHGQEGTSGVVPFTSMAENAVVAASLRMLRVYLRTYALDQMVQAASSSAGLRTIKCVEQFLQELKVHLKTKVPTKAVYAEHLELRKEKLLQSYFYIHVAGLESL